MYAIVVGPPLWWGLLCTCTLCTFGNAALLLLVNVVPVSLETEIWQIYQYTGIKLTLS